MDRRVEHLVGEGFARRQGQRVIFCARVDRYLAQARTQRGGREDLGRRPDSSITHRRRVNTSQEFTGERVTLSSGRFAMIDDGLGFQLVPWRPALEQQLGHHVVGTMMPGGGVDWSFGRKRGLSL